ncbi:MAG: DUF1501 domain-containing protein [Verrucomicrobiota bacterium]
MKYFNFEKQRPRLSRREAIRRTLFAASGLMLADHLSFSAFAAPKTARAKAVIQIWLGGGPSHLDTFDPKPEAGVDYAGQLKSPIETNVSGIRISELMPVLAKQADKYTLIRSMTHGNNGHETASYLVQTGRQPGGHTVFPCVGAVVALTKGYDGGYKGLIPPYVVLTEPQGRFDEAGFLGARYKPFATGGNPANTPFAVDGIITPGITEQRQKNRRELLHKLDTLAQTMAADPQIAATTKAENTAYDMILGEGAKVFDLSQEKKELRESYGLTKFGQSCLVARRLVESGIPYVTINYGGWDMHKDIFPAMRRQLPEFDKGLGTLVKDLFDRGLLDSTIVWSGGEFGRSPKVMMEAPWNGGRNHYGKVFSSFIAGGGFKGGQVVGSSDARGEEVKDRPVYPVDLIGSIYAQLGVDPAAKLPNPEGLPLRVMPTADEGIKSGGLLKEIMPS